MIPLRLLVHWAAFSAVLSGVAFICVDLHSSVFSEILVGGGKLDPISAALVPLIAGGQTCMHASAAGLDVPRLHANRFRSSQSIAALVAVCTVTFLGTWLAVSMVSPEVFSAGLRNFGLGFAVSSLVRLTTEGAYYPAAGAALVFPALLPGAGPGSELLSLPFLDASGPRDTLLMSGFMALGLVLLVFRRTFRQWC